MSSKISLYGREWFSDPDYKLNIFSKENFNGEDWLFVEIENIGKIYLNNYQGIATLITTDNQVLISYI